MLTESQALESVLSKISPGFITKLSLPDSIGRFVAQDVLATIPLPGFDNSMMDGYAVRAIDTVRGGRLKVAGEQPTGLDLRLECQSGQAIRVFTGAPLPAGTDAVIMQEDVEIDGDSIVCLEPVEIGENLRRIGSDLCPGQIVLRCGEKLTARGIGILASQGHESIPTYETPKVAILSTGNELVSPGGGPLQPGQVYDSNGRMLQAMIAELGIKGSKTVHCSDQLLETVVTLQKLIGSFDIVVISGGVSVGDHDHIKPALLELGIFPDFWRVKVKPGKPFLFAQTKRSCDQHPVAIFGLPGNPVSSFVTFQLFVRPALLRWMGALDVSAARMQVTIATDLSNDGNRPHYLRGRVNDGVFHVAGLQQSHALFALSQANALLRLEEGQTIAAGQTAMVLRV